MKHTAALLKNFFKKIKIFLKRLDKIPALWYNRNGALKKETEQDKKNKIFFKKSIDKQIKLCYNKYRK